MLNARGHGPSEPVVSGDTAAVLAEPRWSERGQAPEEEGLLKSGPGAFKIRVVVPTDRKNLALRVFYGFWGLIGTARTSSRAALAIPGNDSGTVLAMAGVGALVAPIVSLGLAAIESIVVAVEFVATLLEKRQTGKALGNAQRKQLEAIAALARHAREGSDDASRACGADGGAARQRLVSALMQGPAPVPQEIVPASPDEASAAANGAARPAAWKAEEEVLKCAARDAALNCMLAAARDRNQRTDTLDAGLTLSRDTVVQGGLVGSAIAQTLKELAFNVAVGLREALLATQVLMLAMGAAHIATGIVGLWRAVRNWRVQDRTMTMFSVARQRLERATGNQLSTREQRHKERILTPFGQATLKTYETIRGRLADDAKRSVIWSAVRIGYGVGSVSVGIASMVVLAGATGGAAIPVLAAALGTAWLIFGVYKLILSKQRKAAELEEAAEFAEAMKTIASRSGSACTLADCELSDLESLSSADGKLVDASNRYYRAALLARYLHIYDEATKNTHPPLKLARVEASATLQAMGVPREITQILKRSSVQATYSWIVSYLNEQDNRALTAIDQEVIAAVKVAKPLSHDLQSADAAIIAAPHT